MKIHFKKEAKMTKKARVKKQVENKQIKNLRKEIEAILSDPEFNKMSKAFRHTLAQRLGIKEIAEGGLVLQAPAPITITELIRRGIGKDDPYSYGNIYSYNFW